MENFISCALTKKTFWEYTSSVENILCEIENLIKNKHMEKQVNNKYYNKCKSSKNFHGYFTELLLFGKLIIWQ